jgi:hypothetical protein
MTTTKQTGRKRMAKTAANNNNYNYNNSTDCGDNYNPKQQQEPLTKVCSHK